MGQSGVGAVYDAYAGVELTLPNRPRVRCRPLQLRRAIRFLRYQAQYVNGDTDALRRLLREFPKAISWPFSPARRLLRRLRGEEVLAVLQRFLEPIDAADLDDDGDDDGDDVTGEDQTGSTFEPPSWEDLVADYAAEYGDPDPTMPWPLFLSNMARASRYRAQRLLIAMDGTAWGASSLLGDTSGSLADMRRSVVAMAYPNAGATVMDDFERAAFAAMQADPA